VGLFDCLCIDLLCGSLLSMHRSLLFVSCDFHKSLLTVYKGLFLPSVYANVTFVGLFCLCIGLFCGSLFIFTRLSFHCIEVSFCHLSM